jgi:hypothetical protein
MLLECCKFGKVRVIHLLTLPAAFLTGLHGSAAVDSLPMLTTAAAGCVAVTFADAGCARNCAAAMGGKKFDGRLLITHVLPAVERDASNSVAADVRTLAPVPSVPIPTAAAPRTFALAPCLVAVPPPPRPPTVFKPASLSTHSVAVSATAPVPSEPGDKSLPTDAGQEELNIEAISSNVDDFLNSLL